MNRRLFVLLGVASVMIAIALPAHAARKHAHKSKVVPVMKLASAECPPGCCKVTSCAASGAAVTAAAAVAAPASITKLAGSACPGMDPSACPTPCVRANSSAATAAVAKR